MANRDSGSSNFGPAQEPTQGSFLLGRVVYPAIAGAYRGVLGSRRRFLLLALPILLISVTAQVFAKLNHDSAWYLTSAAAYLAGGELYGDIFVEVNPPLALFLTLPPVIVAQSTGLFAVDVFVAYVFALIAASLWLCRSMLTDLLPAAARRGLLFCALIALAAAPAVDFGQREHLLVIFALPYLFLAARRAEGLATGAGPAVLIGVFAALGFALKPHFLLVPAVLEVYLLRRAQAPRRLLRPETLGLGVVVLLYLVGATLLTPSYFTQVLPLAIALYDGLSAPWLAVILRGQTPLLALVLLAYLKVRPGLRQRGLVDVLCIAAFCFLVTYFLQLKGWPYQIFPVTACLILALGAYTVNQLDEAAAGEVPYRPGWPLRELVAAAGIVLLSTVALGLSRGEYRNPHVRQMAATMRWHAAGGAAYVFTSNVSVAFPLVTYAGAEWASRFSTLWPLPGLMRRQLTASGDPARLEEIEDFVIDAVVADFEHWRPQFVIVDRRREKPYFGGVSFDYIRFFSRDPRFAAIWQNYDQVVDFGEFAGFRRRSP